MKRILLPLVVVGVLLAPSAAWATGTHTQPTRAPEKPATCPCCVDLDQRIDQLELVFNQRITNLEQTVEQLRNEVTNLTAIVNQLNLNLSITINRLDALRCQSDRVYEFRLRPEVDGSPVVAVSRVEVIGATERGSVRNVDGRFVITADYRGIEAPKGQLRTVTVFARTEAGRTYRLVQKVRLCMEDDGNPNDRGAQDRSEGQS